MPLDYFTLDLVVLKIEVVLLLLLLFIILDLVFVVASAGSSWE